MDIMKTCTNEDEDVIKAWFDVKYIENNDKPKILSHMELPIGDQKFVQVWYSLNLQRNYILAIDSEFLETSRLKILLNSLIVFPTENTSRRDSCFMLYFTALFKLDTDLYGVWEI